MGMDGERYVDWRIRGNCANLKQSEVDRLFFPATGRHLNKAKAVCNGCPVLVTCLEYALDNREQGIWAGTNEADRNKILAFREQLNNPVVNNPRTKIVARTNFTFS